MKKMGSTQVIILAKFWITIIAWCAPLIFLPKGALLWMGFGGLDHTFYLRLLGLAYGALCVSYYFGMREAKEGTFPVAALFTGIVSNGSAFCCISIFGILGVWTNWGVVAKLYMWISLVITFLLAAIMVNAVARRRREVERKQS